MNGLSLLHDAKYHFFINSIMDNQDQIENKIVYDISRTNGMLTLIALKGKLFWISSSTQK